MICVGYIGEEVYDIILYISRTISRLNCRVLIIDFTGSNAMYKAIHHGMGLDSSSGIIHYRGISYIRRAPVQEELEPYASGVVLAVFGYNYKDGMFPCNKLIAVMNTFPHIVDKINFCINQLDLLQERMHVLIRDVISIDDALQVKNKIEFPYKDESVSYLYLELTDYLCAIRCQETQTINFEHISLELKNYILNSVQWMLPELSSKRIRTAIHSARKGR
jgi:hypothetical protein